MKLTTLTSADRERLKNIGFGALPDNPSQAKFGPKEIKGASTRPNLQLFDWLRQTQEYINSDGTIHPISDLSEASDYSAGSILMLVDGDGLVPYVVNEDGTVTAIQIETRTVAFLDGLTYELDDGNGPNTSSRLSIIKDMKVDGISIVQDKEVNITLGDGLSFNNGQLSIQLGNLPEVVPKGLSLGEQDAIHLLAEKGDGTKAYVSASQLDYTRLKVQEEENLSKIGVNDFLFIKEN